MPPTGRAAHPPPSSAGFEPTRWSEVLAGTRDPARRRAALDYLCLTYWPPVYSFLRRQGARPADAEDLTQGFFAEITAGDFLQRPDPARGKFRSYLIGALRQFLAHQHERATAQKRGGGAPHLPLGDPETGFAALAAPGLDPSQAYERAWAITLLARAAQRLEEEQAAAGRTALFQALRPFLYAAPSPGDYEQVAARLGTSRATVAVGAHRLGQRLGELVALEVAATLDDPADADAELRHLKQSLAGA